MLKERSIKTKFRNQKIKKILFIIIFILIVIFYFFFQINIVKTGYTPIIVYTSSMTPTYQGFDLTGEINSPPQYVNILHSDILFLKKSPPHIGDVIVFKIASQPTPIVHRIIAEKIVNGTQYFATKGDANPFTDSESPGCVSCPGYKFGWIPRSAVLGVVFFSIHNSGWFFYQLQNPLIKIFLLFLLFLIILKIYSLEMSNKKEKVKNCLNLILGKYSLNTNHFKFRLIDLKYSSSFLRFSFFLHILG